MKGDPFVVLDAKLFRFNGTGRREGRPMRFTRVRHILHKLKAGERERGGEDGPRAADLE